MLGRVDVGHANREVLVHGLGIVAPLHGQLIEDSVNSAHVRKSSTVAHDGTNVVMAPEHPVPHGLAPEHGRPGPELVIERVGVCHSPRRELPPVQHLDRVRAQLIPATELSDASPDLRHRVLVLNCGCLTDLRHDAQAVGSHTDWCLTQKD